MDAARLEKKLPKYWWWTEQSILLLQSLAMLLLPQDDKAKMHSEDNATPMPLTVTRLTRWMRIDTFERDTAVSQKGLDCVLKQSDINAAAIEERLVTPTTCMRSTTWTGRSPSRLAWARAWPLSLLPGAKLSYPPVFLPTTKPSASSLGTMWRVQTTICQGKLPSSRPWSNSGSRVSVGTGQTGNVSDSWVFVSIL